MRTGPAAEIAPEAGRWRLAACVGVGRDALPAEAGVAPGAGAGDAKESVKTVVDDEAGVGAAAAVDVPLGFARDMVLWTVNLKLAAA